MTRSDVAIFDKEKKYHIVPEASGFVTARTMIMKTRDHFTELSQNICKLFESSTSILTVPRI